MGIPFYFYEIAKSFPDILLQPKNKCDVLFFDYNSLIHPCSHYVINKSLVTGSLVTDESIIQYTLEYTNDIIEKINPDYVYICVDGVAPRSKMRQQRMRRFTKEFETGASVFDSNQITPGTLFMKKLNNALDDWAKEKVVNIVNIVVDSWENPGEGEHKIFKHISRQKYIDKNICIYGLDADLILLCLLEQNNKLSLFRDNSDRDTDYLDITKLRKHLMKSLTGKPKNDFTVILDYVLMVSLLGNDFMDTIPTLNVSSINCLVNNYCRLNLRLTNSMKQVEWYNVKKLLGTIVKQESRIYDAKMKKVYNITLPDTPNVFYYTSPDYIDTTHKYYTFYNVHDPNDCCREYITMLSWVLGYYTGHSHSNWSHVNKYDCAPFASDLVTFLNETPNITFQSNTPLTPRQQLFLVLPKSSISLQNDDKINRLILLDSLQVYFPTKLVIDLICQNKLFKGKALLPDIPDCILDIL